MKRRSYVYPLFRRILCAGIDWYIISLLQSAALIAVYYWQSDSVNMSNHLFDLSFSNAVIACILTVFLYFFYFVFLPARSGGQTPGKRLLHCRLLSEDGTPLSISALCTRAALLLLLEQPLTNTAMYLKELISFSVPSSSIAVVTYISAGITLVSIAIGIKSNRHLFLHDHIVHSMVISDEDAIAKTTAVIK